MKRSFAKVTGLVGMILLGFGVEAQATVRTAGPVKDLKADYFTVPNSGGIPTSSTWITIWGSPYQAPTWGAPASIYPFPPGPGGSMPYGAAVNTFNDYIILHGGGGFDNPARYAAAAAYISYDDGSLPTDLMTVTTIYGMDLAPTVPDSLSMTGYDTAGFYPVLENEQVTGHSGTVYNAGPGQLVPIGALAGILGPGADLSPFTAGNPGSSVWVFQTTMPFSETVPEPATLSLVGVGVAAMAAGRRRRI